MIDTIIASAIILAFALVWLASAAYILRYFGIGRKPVVVVQTPKPAAIRRKPAFRGVTAEAILAFNDLTREDRRLLAEIDDLRK